MKQFPYDKIQSNFYRAIEVTGQAFRHTALSAYMFIRLRKVREITFSHCNIRVIDSFAFQELTLLRRLLLTNNQLGVVHANAFNNLDLTQLSLDNNPHLELKYHALHGLKVSQLSLVNCNLSSITFGTFAPLFPHMQSLSLAKNQLHYVSQEFEPVFLRTKSLPLLSLADNPIYCDCSNLWLIKVLSYRYANQEVTKHNLQQAYDLRYPNCYNHKDLSVLRVTARLLKCHDVHIKSLRLHTDEVTCHSIFTCEASKPGLHFRWNAFLENGTRYTLKDRSVNYNLVSSASSTLYLTESQLGSTSSRINTIECEVIDTSAAATDDDARESSITANITLLKSNCISGTADVGRRMARERHIFYAIMFVILAVGGGVILIEVVVLIKLTTTVTPQRYQLEPALTPPSPPTPTMLCPPDGYYEEPYACGPPPSPPPPLPHDLMTTIMMLNNNLCYDDEPYAQDWRHLATTTTDFLSTAATLASSSSSTSSDSACTSTTTFTKEKFFYNTLAPAEPLLHFYDNMERQVTLC